METLTFRHLSESAADAPHTEIGRKDNFKTEKPTRKELAEVGLPFATRCSLDDLAAFC